MHSETKNKFIGTKQSGLIRPFAEKRQELDVNKE
jgi:hypothetical protein